MKSAIEEIYYGNCSAESFKMSEEYWKIISKCDKLCDRLKKGLNKKQIKILNQLVLESGGLEGEAACAHFKEGFKLGLLIAVEVFN